MDLPKHLLPTTVVGSYPQPEWLVDRAMLSKSVPRIRMHAMWRLPAEHLEEAQDDATIVAIRDMERAGIDIVTDGESAAKAIPTALPPRSMASTPTIPRSLPRATEPRRRSPASSAR